MFNILCYSVRLNLNILNKTEKSKEISVCYFHCGLLKMTNQIDNLLDYLYLYDYMCMS